MAEADVTQLEPRDLRSQAEDFSSRLYNLTNVAKLAAFACEARRVLEGMSNATYHREEMCRVLMHYVPAMNSWQEMEDVAGHVLQELASGLEVLNTEWTAAIYAGTSLPERSSV